MCVEETFLVLLQKIPTVDCLIVTLKFAVAEAQSVVMITLTIVNSDNKIYSCWSTVDGVDNIHSCRNTVIGDDKIHSCCYAVNSGDKYTDTVVRIHNCWNTSIVMIRFNSWIKIDQLDVTCFIISLFTAQHVSNVSTSIFRSLRLIVDLFNGLYCSGSMCVGVAVWFGWGGVVSLCRLSSACFEC